MDIKLLRSFMPEKVSFGTNLEMNDGRWITTEYYRHTYFQTEDQYVEVIFGWNPDWDCYELAFRTILKYKVDPAHGFRDIDLLATFVPDEDMTLDANRATYVFRKVTYVALTQIDRYQKIGFHGATQYLDRVYTRLARMKYLKDMLAKLNMHVIQDGVYIFFETKPGL